MTETQNEAQPEPEEESLPTATPDAKSNSTPEPAKSNLTSRLQRITPKEPTVRFTIDLTESMHRNLSVLAAKTGRKKAEIIRLLLDEALKDLDY